ncbi:hypothetical protein AVEN_249087-1 [Araneus ventricosus]|uniref:Uncharacterized protein n=1 Tax=Araneus ventricosus TaxID=182803 RepID=A0A4Y2P6P5_ARAVE|nr:hypothetical protein AVEN_249087-1 [Araneus ventricosus]
MKIILSIASLLNLLILHGFCNVLQSFHEEDTISCHFHFVCDLNETQKMLEMEEDSSEQAKEMFWETSKEVFGMEGHYSSDDIEVYRVDICSRPEEERNKGFKEMVAIGGENCLVVCMDRSSELCKEFDYLINKFAEYVKEITESEECRKNEDEEMMKKPGGQTMFG